MEFCKNGCEEGVDTGSIDMRGVGMAMVSEERADIPFCNATEGRERFEGWSTGGADLKPREPTFKFYDLGGHSVTSFSSF